MADMVWTWSFNACTWNTACGAWLWRDIQNTFQRQAGGNTKGIAEEIQAQTGADLFEIELVNPYSSDYNTVLDEAQRDQNAQARPELAVHVDNMEDYDIIFIGYAGGIIGLN